MRILNLSFYVIPSRQIDAHLARHQRDKGLLQRLSKDHELIHLQIVEKSAPKPTGHFDLLVNAGIFRSLPVKALRTAARIRPQVVLLHGFAFPFQVLALKIFLGKNVRFIVQHHAEKPPLFPLRRWLTRLAYRSLYRYLFNSIAQAKPFIDDGLIADPGKVREVIEVTAYMKPVDRESARKRTGVTETASLLWVGRLNQNKDPLTVLRGLAASGDSVPWRLYMIFSDNQMQGEVEAFISGHRLNDRVTLIGFVPQKDLADWYSAADYFVAASHYEGSGTALCEALACGCLPIATRIPAFEALTRNQIGFMFPPGDTEQLGKLLKTCPLPSHADRETARAHFETYLSPEAVSEQLLKAILD